MLKSLRVWLLLPLLSAPLILLAACASTSKPTPTIATTISPNTAAICGQWKPITYSATSDSQQTVQENVVANAMMQSFCGR